MRHYSRYASNIKLKKDFTQKISNFVRKRKMYVVRDGGGGKTGRKLISRGPRVSVIKE